MKMVKMKKNTLSFRDWAYIVGYFVAMFVFGALSVVFWRQNNTLVSVVFGLIALVLLAQVFFGDRMNDWAIRQM